MAEGKDHSSIGPLNQTAQKEAMKLVGQILLVMLVTLVALYIVGSVANLF